VGYNVAARTVTAEEYIRNFVGPTFISRPLNSLLCPVSLVSNHGSAFLI